VPRPATFALFDGTLPACKEVTGSYSHRHPALEAVRAAVEQRVPGRQWEHRLAEFNAEASFQDVTAVLTAAIAAARERVTVLAVPGVRSRGGGSIDDHLASGQ
jgi:hypothetical protein